MNNHNTNSKVGKVYPSPSRNFKKIKAFMKLHLNQFKPSPKPAA